MPIKKLSGLLCAVAWLGILLPSARSDAPSVHDVAKTVDRFYNNLGSLRANFSESYQGEGISREEQGILWLKNSGKMRWEYTQPREKLFVADGKTAYFYVPGERQARKTSLKNLDDLRSPLRFLLGKTRLEKEFDSLRLIPSAAAEQRGNRLLQGIPKSLADRVSDVQLEVNSQGAIQRIRIEDIDGSTTEFRFQDLALNPEAPDSKFRLQLPPGVEMIESTTLTP